MAAVFFQWAGGDLGVQWLAGSVPLLLLMCGEAVGLLSGFLEGGLGGQKDNREWPIAKVVIELF